MGFIISWGWEKDLARRVVMCAGLRKVLSSVPSRKVAFSHCPLAGGMLGKGQLFRRVKGRPMGKTKRVFTQWVFK